MKNVQRQIRTLQLATTSQIHFQDATLSLQINTNSDQPLLAASMAPLLLCRPVLCFLLLCFNGPALCTDVILLKVRF